MPYITSVERIGMARQGRTILARQIAKKFSSQPELELPRLEKLKPDDFPELGEQILDFDSLEAVHQWIEQRAAQKHEDN
jgi:hypothetical protein